MTSLQNRYVAYLRGLREAASPVGRRLAAETAS
jgi:hypothetical protein